MSEQQRLAFLLDTVNRELGHLRVTDTRLFAQPFDAQRALGLSGDVDEAERVDAFVARFGRLQDTLGDKLLPAVLRELSEKVGAAIDNLDRAEKLGLIESVDQWMHLRQQRNRMIHEYVRDPAVLAAALNDGHTGVPLLAAMVEAFNAEARRRGWA